MQAVSNNITCPSDLFVKFKLLEFSLIVLNIAFIENKIQYRVRKYIFSFKNLKNIFCESAVEIFIFCYVKLDLFANLTIVASLIVDKITMVHCDSRTVNTIYNADYFGNSLLIT